MAAPSITPLPTPPSRSQSPTTFSADADAFLGALPTFQSEANAQADYLDGLAVDVTADANAAAASATAAANSANIAAAVADYQGAYNPATTYQIGQSVSFGGSLFVANTVNTGVEPVDGANWYLIENGDVVGPASATDGGLVAFDGTSGTLIKAAGTVTAAQGGTGLTSAGTAGNLLTSDGTNWISAPPPASGPVIQFSRQLVTQVTSNFTVPAGVSAIRIYACGKGGDATGSNSGGGGGGGFGFGTLAVTTGDEISVTISGGVSTVTRSGTTLITANAGANALNTTTGGAGGTASVNAILLDRGAFSGGSGGNVCGGGGSAGSPLGNGFAGGPGLSSNGGGGGGGIGGAGSDARSGFSGAGGGAGGAGVTASQAGSAGGGAGGPATVAVGFGGAFSGQGRAVPFADPLLAGLTGMGGYTVNGSVSGVHGQAGGGGSGNATTNGIFCGGDGGFGGGGGGSRSGPAGRGGALGGGGGSPSIQSGTSLAGGGAGGVNGSAVMQGGPATVWIFY